MRVLIAFMIAFMFVSNVDAKTIRSMTQRQHFKDMYPCPSTGKSKGRCPGYIVDHIKALACGGADEPYNMQWQTVRDAKFKDKYERKGCRR